MSESTLDVAVEAIDLHDPNTTLVAEPLTFQTGNDQVSVSIPYVGIPILVKTIGAWVGKNLASGVVGAAGGKIFGAAMEALGLGTGVTEALAEVNQRLDAIEQTLSEIKAVCEEILRRLEAIQLSIDQSFGEGKMGTAFTNIDAAYGTPPTTAQAPASISTPTFMELLNSLAKTKTPAELKVYAAEFVKSVNSTWNISLQVRSIHDALATRVGRGNTLLNRWTMALLPAIEKGDLSLDSAYQTLEGYFLQAVGKQLTGVAMHCFALGAEPGSATRIAYYLQNEFAPLMRAQTDEFLHNVEVMVLARTHVLKVPSVFTMPQSGEYPWEMESIFLRADLLCAALNLVGNTRNVTLRDAIDGVYGRCLARRSDIKDNVGPETDITGLQKSRGKVAGTLDVLHAVDLRRDGNQLILEDKTNSGPTVVRYYLPWSGARPAQGVPIDTKFRGGIRPAFYNVFADGDWPLAAGFVDFRPLLTGAPAGTPATLGRNDLFPTHNLETVIEQSPFVAPASHPLVSPVESIIEWTFAHTAKAVGTWHRTTAFNLFKYTGTEARMRLHLNVWCEVQSVVRQKYLRSLREIDLNAKVVLIHKPIEGTQVYDSRYAQGDVLYLANRDKGYRASVDSWKQLDFTVKPGEYALHLDFLTWLGTQHSHYTGWESDRLAFKLKGVFVEWL